MQIFIPLLSFSISVSEPPHDKTNNVAVRPAKAQISLGICPVCSESSLCAQWVAKDPAFLHADSEDSNTQSDQSLRWAHSHVVDFVMRWLILMKLFIGSFIPIMLSIKHGIK